MAAETGEYIRTQQSADSDPNGNGQDAGRVGNLVAAPRHVAENQAWPRRLVWCLPMRTLVEQTKGEAERLVQGLGLADQVDVHVLMGGIEEHRWYREPDRPKILVGTQDMLLSRALNRGYAMYRAAWPRAFGLLGSDCLWVMDEVQLMGVGLTTSAQLQAFFDDHSSDGAIDKPRVTWWMSATLQPDWLCTAETEPGISALKESLLSVDPDDRSGPQWEAMKPTRRIEADADEWPQLILDRHGDHYPDPNFGRQTLVVVNTVRRAMEVYAGVTKRSKATGDPPEIKLIHSRFRPFERRSWLNDFLSKSSLNPNTNRILIATQVVEAGVDTTASCLMTELAPWPSLVQRFGRSARYGGRSDVVVLDHGDEKQMPPYEVADCVAARSAIDQLDDVAIGSLEDFETSLDADRLRELYPFNPLHVLLRHEFEELFDTSADLSGSDIDISRYVRDGDDARDVNVLWRDWDDERPAESLQPRRDELCSISIMDARKWIKKINRGMVWVWDYLVGQWEHADANRLRPGMTILVDPSVGGYDVDVGFTGAKAKRGQRVPPALEDSPDDDSQRFDAIIADAQEDSEAFSQADVWKTIATHCREASAVAQTIMRDLQLPDSIVKVVELAMRLHDWGKAHPAFARGTYRCDPVREDLAKAPGNAWQTSQLYHTESHGPRSGFRHELASCLATLELLRGADPQHSAILGPFSDWLEACDLNASTENEAWADHPLAIELKSLSRHEFNLLLFLIAAHHGKVRTSMQASPKDQGFPTDSDFVGEGYPIRGVREGDVMPATVLPTTGGETATPELILSISPASMGLSPRYGASWSERMSDLLRHYGPFTLGYLEAIVRAADGRASDESRSPGCDLDPNLTGVTLKAVVEVPEEQVRQVSEAEVPANV